MRKDTTSVKVKGISLYFTVMLKHNKVNGEYSQVFQPIQK